MKQFIIIGAGILGASTAYHLAKAGVEVALVDRKEPGQATDAAAGIICPWVSQRRNKAWYALAKGGAAYYRPLIKQLEEDGETETGYKQVGAINLHTDNGKLEKLEERAILRREDAPEIGEVRRLSAQETSALFPSLSDQYESVHISGAARVNGRAIRDAMITAAVKHGADIVHGSAQLLHAEGQVTGVCVGDQLYEADKVIITAGAWAAELLTPLGIKLKVAPQKAQIVHLQLEDTKTEDWPVVIPPNNQYILAFDGGRVVVGATHEDDMGFDRRVTSGGLHEILDKALTVAPDLRDGELVETRVGFRPFTPNFLPIIGEVPGIDGLLLSNGLGASGLTVGPYLGAQLAKLALGQNVDINLELYDVAGAIEI
ncbi:MULTISPECIES: FAD-binding oxidoreductase [unclassified Bacillus (in: firmicutes)]|uniref:NAD(P)/FAD-dependent oxidoreductase n=1 Tax=unclassified Bacillus (in: firmicutes) TaxID=185979 RepID=UPI0008E4BBC4|nr:MULTISPECIES: FAD-dependent oxidoreductase [unclassified Bacillus (in: firmicutes)]SFB02675.1 D-amino acid dehydrogenase small subunit [Bacillus sp. UNCCL13]SFQ89031.1 D-amino acid dehydrogenase small subunit [Bacillus sp. cl95]